MPPLTLIDVLQFLQDNHASIDGIESPVEIVYGDWLAGLDDTLSTLSVSHESIVGGPASISFERWSTAYLTDLAQEHGADISDAAVGTWIASNAAALTHALQKCAMGFMLDADPIPGGDDA